MFLLKHDKIKINLFVCMIETFSNEIKIKKTSYFQMDADCYKKFKINKQFPTLII